MLKLNLKADHQKNLYSVHVTLKSTKCRLLLRESMMRKNPLLLLNSRNFAEELVDFLECKDIFRAF